jgi:hypothetical protein
MKLGRRQTNQEAKARREPMSFQNQKTISQERNLSIVKVMMKRKPKSLEAKREPFLHQMNL